MQAGRYSTEQDYSRTQLRRDIHANRSLITSQQTDVCTRGRVCVGNENCYVSLSHAAATGWGAEALCP